MAPDNSPAHLRTTVSSPLGILALAAGNRGLRSLSILGSQAQLPPGRLPAKGLLRDAALQIKDYFLGQLREFDLPLDLVGTPFQLLVWHALRKVPFGETLSYGDLAARIGRPKSARAVGAANARNPVAIVVPCHRILGAGGSLSGYAAGLEAKHALLEHEARVSGNPRRDPRQLTLID